MISYRLLQNIFKKKQKIQQKKQPFLSSHQLLNMKYRQFCGVISWVTFCFSQSSQANHHEGGMKNPKTRPTNPTNSPSGFLEPQVPRAVGAFAAVGCGMFTYIYPIKIKPSMYCILTNVPKRMVVVYGLVNLSFCVTLFSPPQNYGWSTYIPPALFHQN